MDKKERDICDEAEKIIEKVTYMEKVYLYQERKILGYMLMGILSLFVALLFFVMRASMGPTPSLTEMVINIFVVILPVCAVVAFLYPFVIYPYFGVREIVFSKNGMLLKRGFRPITIQKITDLKSRTFRGKEVNITITGLAPDGRKVRKTLARKSTGVDKRWEEFKADLQKIKSK